eukprot:TRINITY_DN8714_c0_g1_i5.p1 TRINITY_DN8714_c0_g1~~TRINITY_DN8714_c0_g1_i5.p1  ORF type:complete len:459 (-),score=93.54 TRINITY_DN8714_c0_g1_i5:151-1527(-)
MEADAVAAEMAKDGIEQIAEEKVEEGKDDAEIEANGVQAGVTGAPQALVGGAGEAEARAELQEEGGEEGGEADAEEAEGKTKTWLADSAVRKRPGSESVISEPAGNVAGLAQKGVWPRKRLRQRRVLSEADAALCEKSTIAVDSKSFRKPVVAMMETSIISDDTSPKLNPADADLLQVAAEETQGSQEASTNAAFQGQGRRSKVMEAMAASSCASSAGRHSSATKRRRFETDRPSAASSSCSAPSDTGQSLPPPMRAVESPSTSSFGQVGLPKSACFAVTGVQITQSHRELFATIGASLSESWSPATTHLLAQTFRRTTKLMSAVCTGGVIVTPAFVEACCSAGRLLEPDPFLLRDSVCEAAFAKKHGLLSYSLQDACEIARRRNRPFLEGLEVSCTDAVVGRRELEAVVVAAGGRWRAEPAPSPAECLIRLGIDYEAELLWEGACTQVLRRDVYKLD